MTITATEPVLWVADPSWRCPGQLDVTRGLDAGDRERLLDDQLTATRDADQLF